MSAPTSLALRTMLISTCQSLLSSNLSQRPRSQQMTVLRTLPILTDFRCRCSCTPVWWRHLGPFPLWYEGVRFLCFGGLNDCRICGDRAFYLNSKRTVCRFWCFCCCLSLFIVSVTKVFVYVSSSVWIRLSISAFVSSCFNVLSATFTSWIVAPYLLHAPYTSSECNFKYLKTGRCARCSGF